MAIGIVTQSFVSTLLAGDLSDEPVGARISLAKDRILLFTDAVARQASAGYPMASSTNPAADDFLRTPPADYQGYGLVLTSDVFFEVGTYVTAFSTIGAVRLEEAGTLTAALVRLDSFDGHSRQNDDYALRSNELFLGYSQHLTEWLAIGVEMQLTDSTLKIDDTVSGLPRHTESDTFGVGFNVGLLVALHESFTIGLHGGVKWDRTDTDGKVTPAGPAILIDLHDTTEVTKLRLGMVWRADPQLALSADIEYVHLDDDFGTTEVGRFYVGTEYFFKPTLAFRFGVVLDTQPQAGVTAGMGYYGIENVPIELAYAFNTFPEVRREFGRAHLMSLSIVFLF